MNAADEAIRIGVHARQSGLCGRCGEPLGSPLAWTWSCHHRKLRGQGGADTAENRLGLCGSGTTKCHGHVHSRITEAKENGWIVPSWGDPAAVPVTMWNGTSILLDSVFGITPYLERNDDDGRW